MTDFSWVNFASGLVGAILGSGSQLLVHFSRFRVEAGQQRRELFDKFEVDLLHFMRVMQSVPEGTAQPEPNVSLELYALQGSVRRLMKRREGWLESEAVKRVENRVLNMGAHSDIGELAALRDSILRILHDWERGTFDPDTVPVDFQSSLAPRFDWRNEADDSPAFPVAPGATRTARAPLEPDVLPKPRRRFLLWKLRPSRRSLSAKQPSRIVLRPGSTTPTVDT
jgi:hypothetical protein